MTTIVYNRKCCKFYCILPKESIKLLLNNYVERFEWELYLKCLHRYCKDDELSDDYNFLQRNSLIKNSNTILKKRGKPKKRSRIILVDYNKEIEKQNDWIIVNKKEYMKFSMKKEINKFVYFMYKNKYNFSEDLNRIIYNFII